ncbi:MAG TPA: sulfite exporter TauE/SafE family protein [Bacteroidia bacterium]|nr:sulfite exporter TauE/SafE family protein [Bacteroidia bacterium]HRU61265.1 sulfite exporter TauE/SafE family protein [Bacteroidia bacterium]
MTLELLGYAGAILMGLSLGLIGGGGSILTVPILVYLFSVDAVLATAYSLFVVGLTSLIGSFSHMRLGNIHWRTAIVFGIPSIISVYLTRAYVVPAIPDPVFHLGDTAVSKAHAILLLFAVIMLLASYSMIRKRVVMENEEAEPRYNYPLILLEGIVVGAVTGLVGAGGGFLIIPALVLLAKLPMKQAVGTSLIIIAAKSLIGFTGDLKGNQVIDWRFLLIFSLIAMVGIIAGSMLSRNISNEKLKPAFGWFVLVMGVYIIAKEMMG